MNWRRFFPILLLFSCVDGFISNVLYPAVLPLLYRDFLVLGVYLLFLIQGDFGRWMSPMALRIGRWGGGLALFFFLIGLVQVFNPQVPNLTVGLLGFKVYYFYWPMALLAYAYSDDVAIARNLIRWLVCLSVLINLFGLYQFWSGPEFLANTFGPGFERATLLFASEEDGDDYETSFLRVIGTFASTGQYANFLVINCMFCFCLLLSTQELREKLFSCGALFLSFCALLATGSRGPAIMLALCVLVMFRLCSGTLRTSWSILLSAVGIRFAFQWLGGPVANRFETIRDIEMVSHRTIETTPVQFQEILGQHPLGMGLGIATTASRHVSGEVGVETFLVENHASKLLLEVGIFGVVLFYLLAAALIIRWLTHWIPRDPESRNFLGPLSAFGITFLALSFMIGGFDSPPQSFFFWVTVGIVLRLSAPPKASPLAVPP